MGINGRQTSEASWMVKLYWRSKCGRTLSPGTGVCHNCGEVRPLPDDITRRLMLELEHACGPDAVKIRDAIAGRVA